MPRVAVVSDTTAYLPDGLARHHEIHLVPLYVNFGPDQSVPEDRMPDFDTFYDELRSPDELPTTSRPTVADFLRVYEPLLDEGRDVISVHLSGGLSGTVDAAREAVAHVESARGATGRLHVLDSSTAGGGLGLMALAAAHRGRGAGSLEEVADAVSAARLELKTWVALDTLEFLKRSDRVGAAKSWIGSTLGIKPILTVEWDVQPVERVRTSERVTERLVDYARQRAGSGASAWFVQHVQAPDQAAQLVDACTEVFGRPPEFVTEVGPVIGVHTGPRMLAMGALPPHHIE